jgi:hypothetical protein
LTIGKLNVYITALGQPCVVDNQPWVVAVAHCDGNILNWSEGRYRERGDGPWIPITQHIPSSVTGTPALPAGWWYDSIPASNGHVEIEIPPGCYSVVASKHTWTGTEIDLGFARWVLYGNWATDHGIVTVGCDEHVCVTLYSPTVMPCWKRLFDFVRPLGIAELLRPRSRPAIREEDVKAIEQAFRLLDEKFFKPLTADVPPHEMRIHEHLSRRFAELPKSTKGT